MRTTGIFTTHRFAVKLQKREPIYIIPFGDVHWNTKLCARNVFRRDIGWGKNNPNVYYIGMGDYLDLISAHERVALSNPDLHESTLDTFEKLYIEECDKFLNEIDFMKGRVIGLLEGNHFGRFREDGTTTTDYLAKKLNTKSLGCMSIVRMTIEYFGRKCALDICAYHGKGASRLIGGSLNAVQHMAEGISADIYMMGHDHRRVAAPNSRLCLVTNVRTGQLEVKEKTQWFCRTGSYLRGYVDNHASYVADSCSPPLSLGGIRFEIKSLAARKKDDLNEEIRTTVAYA